LASISCLADFRNESQYVNRARLVIDQFQLEVLLVDYFHIFHIVVIHESGMVSHILADWVLVQLDCDRRGFLGVLVPQLEEEALQVELLNREIMFPFEHAKLKDLGEKTLVEIFQAFLFF